MELWDCDNYKEWLKFQAQQQRGVVKRWAQACGCQASYLSQVMHGSPHLTVDQAFVISARLNLAPLEAQYFQLLVDHARSHLADYRQHIEAQLQRIRRDRQKVSKQIEDSARPAPEIEALYYSTWHWSAIHLLTSLGKGLSAEDIGRQLNLPMTLVSDILHRLQSWDLVARSPGGLWSYHGPSIHLDPGSPFLIRHHDNWRRQAVDRAFQPDPSNLHYTALYALSPKERTAIHDLLLKLIAQSRKLAGPASSEEVVGLNIDWFRL